MGWNSSVDHAHDHRRDRRSRIDGAFVGGQMGRRQKDCLGMDLHDPGSRDIRGDILIADRIGLYTRQSDDIAKQPGQVRSVSANSLAMPKSALIIEDDADIAESVRYNLASEGFAPLIAATGEQGLSLALDSKNPPELIVLDLMLPGMSGMELCRRLRRETQTRKTPIIMLTAKTSESDRIAGLDLGADDYITKPFSVKELLARVRAVLRRVDEGVEKRYEDDLLTIDFVDIRATCKGENIKFTNKEFTLLSLLAKNADRVLSRD